MSAFFFYSLFYFLVSGCLLYPPAEFVSAGLTIQDVFASWLGSENQFFVEYHMKRSTLTLFVHSILPFGYMLGLLLFGHIDTAESVLGGNLLPFLIVSALVPLYALHKIFQWSAKNWRFHPIVRNLTVYCNNSTTWETVASDINIEYRRVGKIKLHCNSVTSVIATDNWIIKVTPYKLNVAHQSDTALIVNRTDTHTMSPITRTEVQFINIEVKPTRTGAQAFDIRLNALDFKDLQDKISRPITILQNITFHKTLLDRFIDTFKEQVQSNPLYHIIEEPDQCIGCMQAPSNIKLSKQCDSNAQIRSPEDCNMCFCRPMWCIDCMAKWFASRQDENAPETWMSSKCTCPVCRARFCLLDVCFVQHTN